LKKLAEEFFKDFEAASKFLGVSLASESMQSFVTTVEATLRDGIIKLEQMARSNKDLSYIKGDVAEAYHALTFNADAARLGKRYVRASLPRDSSPYDIIMSNGHETITAQLKYYNSPAATENAISHSKHDHVDQKVVPTDQLQGSKISAAQRVARNAERRPAVAKSHADTRNKISDHIEMDGARSKPLSEHDAREITKNARSEEGVTAEAWAISTNQIIQWSDILRESGTAAMQAAISSVAIQSVPYLFDILKKAFENGELRLEDFGSLAQATPSAFLTSGIPAGLTAFIVGAAQAGKLTVTLQQLDPTIIALAVLLALNALGISFKAAKGEISWKEAFMTIADNSFMLTMAMAGGVLGQSIIQVPVLGALIGNIVGAFFGRQIIEGKNYVQMALAVETGWTFFGLVEQDYEIPEDVLRGAGYKLLNIKRISPKRISVSRVERKLISVNRLDVPILKRGVISFGHVGYIRQF
jgi:hypothetical protein